VLGAERLPMRSKLYCIVAGTFAAISGTSLAAEPQ